MSDSKLSTSPASLGEILQRNREWADATQRADPDFLPNLANQQRPKYLWIGCSDSRVPVSQITGTVPGDIFVHRNVANIVQPDDPSCQSVLEFAIHGLGVEHVILCGHYKCGGVQAAMQGSASGTLGQWISSISGLYASKTDVLSELPEPERFTAMCEMNVQLQLKNLANSRPVQDAWTQGKALDLHGWIYNLQTGLIEDLGLSISGNAGL